MLDIKNLHVAVAGRFKSDGTVDAPQLFDDRDNSPRLKLSLSNISKLSTEAKHLA